MVGLELRAKWVFAIYFTDQLFTEQTLWLVWFKVDSVQLIAWHDKWVRYYKDWVLMGHSRLPRDISLSLDRWFGDRSCGLPRLLAGCSWHVATFLLRWLSIQLIKLAGETRSVTQMYSTWRCCSATTLWCCSRTESTETLRSLVILSRSTGLEFSKLTKYQES